MYLCVYLFVCWKDCAKITDSTKTKENSLKIEADPRHEADIVDYDIIPTGFVYSYAGFTPARDCHLRTYL